MSRLDQLIRQLAPEGVVLRTLGEVGQFIRGNGLQKADLTSWGTPAIHYGQVHTIYGVWTSATRSFTSSELSVKLRKANTGDLIIATTSEDDAAVGKATAWLGAEDVAVSGDAYIFRHRLDPRYVSYYFKSEHFRTQKIPYITGTKVRRISGESLARIRIPEPPLEVQREIVRILDNFTELEVELQAELEARRRQYAFHLDNLISSNPGVRRRSLGEFAQLVRGNGMPKADFTESGFPAIHYGQIYTYYGTWTEATKSFVSEATASRLTKVQPGNIVITNTSENLDDVGKAVAWLGDRPAVTGGHATVIRHSENSKYLAYYFGTTEFNIAKRAYAKGTKVIDVSARDLAKIQIPLPPRVVQDQIAGALDNFDALVNDLSIGLPAELAARRKQYEYYRDKLLTFKEAPA